MRERGRRRQDVRHHHCAAAVEGRSRTVGVFMRYRMGLQSYLSSAHSLARIFRAVGVADTGFPAYLAVILF